MQPFLRENIIYLNPFFFLPLALAIQILLNVWGKKRNVTQERKLSKEQNLEMGHLFKQPERDLDNNYHGIQWNKWTMSVIRWEF